MKAVATAGLIVVGAGLDLATKAWARTALEPYGPPLDFLPFVSLRLTFNEGVSFSLLSFKEEARSLALLAATGLLTAVVIFLAFRFQGWKRLALSAVAAGALANFIDRAIFRAVTDFLGMHFGTWHPFVFNLADVWISLGVGLLLTGQMLFRPSGEDGQKP